MALGETNAKTTAQDSLPQKTHSREQKSDKTAHQGTFYWLSTLFFPHFLSNNRPTIPPQTGRNFPNCIWLRFFGQWDARSTVHTLDSRHSLDHGHIQACTTVGALGGHFNRRLFGCRFSRAFHPFLFNITGHHSIDQGPPFLRISPLQLEQHLPDFCRALKIEGKQLAGKDQRLTLFGSIRFLQRPHRRLP